MKLLYAVLLTFPIVGSAQSDATITAMVWIDAVNESGAPVLCWLMNFTNTGSKHDFGRQFQHLEGVVPFGTYDYTVALGPPGMTEVKVSRRVTIRRAEEMIVTVISGAAGVDLWPEAGYEVVGRVEPVPQGDALVRIRFSPLDAGNELDVHVDYSGQFRLDAPLDGRYVLTVIRGLDVLDVEVVTFDWGVPSAPLVIKLPGTHPATKRIHPISGHRTF